MNFLDIIEQEVVVNTSQNREIVERALGKRKYEKENNKIQSGKQQHYKSGENKLKHIHSLEGRNQVRNNARKDRAVIMATKET